MRRRCYDKRHQAYHNYGGRGIKVCDAWRDDLPSFYAWAVTNGYTDDLTLDRVDNDGDYTPANCRWITAAEQHTNRRDNRLVSLWGETKPVVVWLRDPRVTAGLRSDTVRYRLNNGMPPEEAFTTPVGEARVRRKK